MFGLSWIYFPVLTIAIGLLFEKKRRKIIGHASAKQFYGGLLRPSAWKFMFGKIFETVKRLYNIKRGNMKKMVLGNLVENVRLFKVPQSHGTEGNVIMASDEDDNISDPLLHTPGVNVDGNVEMVNLFGENSTFKSDTKPIFYIFGSCS